MNQSVELVRRGGYTTAHHSHQSRRKLHTWQVLAFNLVGETSDMIHLRRPVMFLIGLLMTASIALIAGVSVAQSETALVQTKTEQALSITMENLAPQWPRIETHSALSAGAYYAPIVNPVQEFELHRHVLEYLNQDTSVPPVKITQVSVSYEDGSSEGTLIGQARVEFPLLLGIEKEMLVHGAVKIPHYKTPK